MPPHKKKKANHGGGYSYRLCPADKPLNEECFQRTPLPFVGLQGLRWGGGDAHGGTEVYFNGTYVRDGVSPPGSVWAKNPIPLIGGADGLPGPVGVPQFAPRCTNTTMCTGMGDGDQSDARLEIVDRVRIPDDLPDGDYVLGWRWDCEQSNQIWQSCSDVAIRQRRR